MARIALIKVFTGLNLGVSQLSGELQRAGHESLIVFFKDYVTAPEAESHRYLRSEMTGTWVGARGTPFNCNLYKPFTDREYELLVETLEAFDPDLIGMSLCSVAMKECAEVTRRLKRRLRTPIVWGGAGPTLEPERALEVADLVCVGEGEPAILELASRLDAGAPLAGVGNVWTRLPDGTIDKGPRAPLVDIETIAFPDYEESRCVHIDEDRRWINVYPHNLGRQYYIMTQRGCPYSCSFCIESWYQEQWGKKESLRRRSVDLVIEELVQAKRQRDIQAVMFYDDVFTVNPRWIREFAPKYKAHVGLPFWCYTYPRTTKPDDLAALKDAGCVSMTMGIQSGSAQVLEAYNRPVDREITLRAARLIIEAGIVGFFDLMTQSQYETEATCRETFEFLLDLPRELQTVGLYPMTLFPNYGYTEKVETEGRQRLALSDADYDYWHKLYLLTRTPLPRWAKQTLGRLGLVRRFPRLIDPLLPKRLPFFYIDNGAIDLQNNRLEVTDARGARLREHIRRGSGVVPRPAAAAAAGS